MYNANNPILNAVRNYELALTEFEKDYNDQTLQRLEVCTSEMDELEALDVEAKVHEVVQRLKIAFLDKKSGTFQVDKKTCSSCYSSY